MKFALELFAGKAVFTRAMLDANFRMVVPFELNNGSEFDLSNRDIQDLILGWIDEQRIWYVHLATPCTTFSNARNKEAKPEKKMLAMELLRFTIKVIRKCIEQKIYWSLENPRASNLWRIPEVMSIEGDQVFKIVYHCCAYGCPYFKPTTILTNCKALKHIEIHCNKEHEHVVLKGRLCLPSEDGKHKWCWMTSLASEYAPQLCKAWAFALKFVAPSDAIRYNHEPCILPFWQHSAQRAIGVFNTNLITELTPCPEYWINPWRNIISTWGR